MPASSTANHNGWIELMPGVPWASPEELNRLARQQGLCLAIAQAAVYDEICQAVNLSQDEEMEAVRTYVAQQEIHDKRDLEQFLKIKGWSQADLTYFSTKGERLQRFQEQVFSNDVSLRFLETKLDRDQISYSLIRVSDGDLAFELHQRLQEAEASFEQLAAEFSEGAEQSSGGSIGPVPVTQAHPTVANKLRTSQPGQLWPPFFLENIWLILRLDQWEGARLNDATRNELLDELFDEWVEERVSQLLAGNTPSPLPYTP
ncbi:peptidylprolyl isomerase [Synechococcus sp. RS9902]|uniref:peptidylprolyl isomerase n=1 Tax=Synechococcus sp. RS9902 TaxID=221345 RepID=UPI00164586AD|nr:peptidylprolyl isomerase [Synechococcus sp. RS9902]QNI96549.1 PPIC-type PPIASE domain-containing protein [Synechococcus sp. RS9902]